MSPFVAVRFNRLCSGLAELSGRPAGDIAGRSRARAQRRQAERRRLRTTRTTCRGHCQPDAPGRRRRPNRRHSVQARRPGGALRGRGRRAMTNRFRFVTIPVYCIHQYLVLKQTCAFVLLFVTNISNIFTIPYHRFDAFVLFRCI